MKISSKWMDVMTCDSFCSIFVKEYGIGELFLLRLTFDQTLQDFQFVFVEPDRPAIKAFVDLHVIGRRVEHAQHFSRLWPAFGAGEHCVRIPFNGAFAPNFFLFGDFGRKLGDPFRESDLLADDDPLDIIWAREDPMAEMTLICFNAFINNWAQWDVASGAMTSSGFFIAVIHRVHEIRIFIGHFDIRGPKPLHPCLWAYAF